MTLTNQNNMQKEIRRLNSWNDSHHFSHHTIYKYNDWPTKTTKFPIVFMGIKHGLSHWGKTTDWEHSRIGCCDKIAGGIIWEDNGGNCIMRSFMIYTARQIWWSNGEGWNVWRMWHTWGRSKMYTLFWPEDLKERDCFEELGILLDTKIDLREYSRMVWTGFVWPQIQIDNYCTECDLKFQKM